jgi:Flp pilus assembly pilin Flp
LFTAATVRSASGTPTGKTRGERRRSAAWTIRGRPEPEAGQASTEYAVILAAIAVCCLVAVLFLGLTIRSHFDDSGGDPASPAPFTPPATSPRVVDPTTLEECEHGGWRHFPQFRNERECKDYVRSLEP